MTGIFRKLIKVGAVCGLLTVMTSFPSMAAIGPGFTEGTYVAEVTADTVNINKYSDSEEVLMTAEAGEVFEVLEDLGNGWMKIRVCDTEGYLPASETAEVYQVDSETMEEVQQEAIESSASFKRQQVADYALQFVGGRYKWGGTDPNTGVDCSGFTRYVLKHAADISVDHSAKAQSGQGTVIGADQIRPGDLVFYGKGKKIDHVSMYIGDGEVVHAGSERTGITVSEWDYRTPLKVVSFME